MDSKYIKLILITIFIACGLMGYSQDYVTHKEVGKKVKKLYDEALQKGRSSQYEKAIDLLNKAIKKEPGFIDAYLLKSGMYYNQEDYKSGIATMHEAIKLAPEYDSQAYYSLAAMYRLDRQYDEAAECFQKFINIAPKDKRIARAKKLLEQSKFAAEAIKNPVPFEPILLGSMINTSDSEYMPRRTIDGKQLIFTRRVRGQEDFYIATMEGDSIISCRPIDELNTPYNEGVHTVSADGKKIIYTACDRKIGEGSCDLYYSELVDGNWTPEMSFNSEINTPTWEGQPSLSADGSIIFFSSSRPGGKGGRDIWFSIKNDSTGWSKPYNMASINTPGNEESPFLHPDGRTFYFRSDGRVGMGGYDIYYTKFDFEKKEWEEPKNIGYPINTEGSEGALAISLDGKMAYFASDMAHLDKEVKNLDIYRFELYEEARPLPTTYVKATIVDAETGAPIEASYAIRNQSKDVIMDDGIAHEGTFLSALPIHSNYACIVDMPGYVYHSERFELDEVNTSLDPYEIEIALQKAEIVVTPDKPKKVERKPIVMKNIFFVSGSAELRDESAYELNHLYETLINNPNMRIKIIGHTDDVGQEADNMKLSTDRALSVVNYLKGKGITASRLEHEGRGELEPIADNSTEAGRLLNRRTEFIIL